MLKSTEGKQTSNKVYHEDFLAPILKRFDKEDLNKEEPYCKEYLNKYKKAFSNVKQYHEIIKQVQKLLTERKEASLNKECLNT